MSNPIKIWTDGSCSPNPGRGGWAWVREDASQELGHAVQTTNYRMELTAVIKAVNAHAGQNILLISDSKYVIDGATRRNLKRLDRISKKGNRVPNRDLWLQLFAAMARANVHFQWVRGHDGDPGNERADRLAKSAAAGK